VIRGISECHQAGQPVLVGTTSIESSELLSKMLTAQKLPHQVLNAKQHAREAEIVAQAGRPGVITIATNMAGRGTDIVLGGNVEKQIDLLHANADISEEDRNLRIEQLKNEWQALHDAVIAAGGLHIIGTERHESRRVDNQLRGRSGRQGDPGSSRFYLSLDDPLLRIFAGDRVRAIMDRLKMPEDEPIEAGLVMRSIESAQRKVEARNFDVRKQLLEYDDVSNDQRKVIYQQRNELLASSDISETITSLRQGVVSDLVRVFVPEGSLEEQWDLPGLERTLAAEFQVNVAFADLTKNNASVTDEDIVEKAVAAADAAYALKVEAAGREQLSRFERSVMLTSIDSHWREHLAALDHLRQGIHLRSFAQKNPKQEYKREAFELFSLLLTAVGNQVTRDIMSVNIRPPEAEAPLDLLPAAPPPIAPPLANVQYKHAEFDERAVLATAAESPDDIALAALGVGGVAAEEAKSLPQRRYNEKVGRNDPCPCGSGKKYKACHGKLD
jgi:preprotein translocase subunit SecA